MKVPERLPNKRELEIRYQGQHSLYEATLSQIERRVREAVERAGLHPVMKYRIKGFDSFFDKLLRLRRKAGVGDNELMDPCINDIIAIRVICPFLEDLRTVERILQDSFRVIEIERKGAERSFSEFGYDSIHVLVAVPQDLRERYPTMELDICEVQIRTILQEAWAEVEHELVYKAQFDPKDDPMRRKLAAMNANLTLSDLIFQDIRDYQRKFMQEISTRRQTFFSKIQDEIDDDFFGDSDEVAPEAIFPGPVTSARQGDPNPMDSIDDLLLQGLTAHNDSDFQRAIGIYSEILKRSPPESVAAIVHEHRGMAYFAQSLHAEALQDFTQAVALEPASHKSSYYRGVVNCVLARYGDAVRDFDRAIELEPYHFYYYFRRAQAWFHLADYPRALSDCDAALGLEPEDVHANQLKGMIMARLRF